MPHNTMTQTNNGSLKNSVLWYKMVSCKDHHLNCDLSLAQNFAERPAVTQ